MAKAAKAAKLSALITGAGSGIGRATAELLLEDGWSVAFVDISEKALADVKATWGEKKGTHFIVADVSDENAVERAVAEAARFLNGVDAAVVMWNASTQFCDGGEFGFGAEIGISTQKLHARGPMGLRQLTTYKYLVWGEGQVRG